MVDREKIFTSRHAPPPGSGFRAVRRSGPRDHSPLLGLLSILFALAGLRYTIHNWRHPDGPSVWATPLLAVAILLAAWNRFNRRRR